MSHRSHDLHRCAYNASTKFSLFFQQQFLLRCSSRCIQTCSPLSVIDERIGERPRMLCFFPRPNIGKLVCSYRTYSTIRSYRTFRIAASRSNEKLEYVRVEINGDSRVVASAFSDIEHAFVSQREPVTFSSSHSRFLRFQIALATPST